MVGRGGEGRGCEYLKQCKALHKFLHHKDQLHPMVLTEASNGSSGGFSGSVCDAPRTGLCCHCDLVRT